MHASNVVAASLLQDAGGESLERGRRERGLSQFIQLTEQNPSNVKEELLAGLKADHAHVSPKYLYDALGSKLFEAICELPEYYPTRTEALIFAQHARDIAEVVGTGSTMVDLGAGNCAKAASLFAVLQPSQYVPVDISVEFLRDAVHRLHYQFPQIAMAGIGMDFSSTLTLPPAVHKHDRLFFYPGSSIGNFTPAEALAFLQRVHAACIQDGEADGGILISVDLVKDAQILDAAYDDALGVTASFNLNLLQHMNHLLEADFDLRAWRHRGFFNPEKSRIEMHLEALGPQTVRWPGGGVRRFETGERIHTENSYKYTRQGFVDVLTQAGFESVTVWTDPQDWFLVCHARAGKARM